MPPTKLEELLRTTVLAKNRHGQDIQVPAEFRVAIQNLDHHGGVHFLIHPSGHNGTTLDFVCYGNNLTRLP